MNCDIMNNKILSANWFTRQLAAGFTFDPVVAQALDLWSGEKRTLGRSG